MCIFLGGTVQQPHPFELLPHTADMAIKVHGATPEELFSNALDGMFACARPLLQQGQQTTETITVAGHTRESLLVNFLSEALYLSDVHNAVYSVKAFDSFSSTALTVTLIGTPITGFDGNEIKAVTYHHLAITQQSDGPWTTTIVFDT